MPTTREPTPSRQLAQIVRYRGLAAGRRGRHELFALLVLAPMIGLGAFLAVERVLSRGRELVRGLLQASLPGPLGDLGSEGALAFALAAGASLAVWPACRRELYGRAPLKVLVDREAVTGGVRFPVAVLAILLAALPVALLLLLFFWILSPDPIGSAGLLRWLLRLYPAAIGAALVQLPLTLWQVHAGGRWPHLPAAGLAALAPFLLPGTWPLLAPWAGIAGNIRRVLGEALPFESTAAAHPLSGPWLASPWALATTSLVGLGLGALGFSRWQRLDLEAAGEQRASNGTSRSSPVLTGSPVGLLVLRDLRLLWRRFSPAVPLAAAASGLLLLASAAAATDSRLPPLWRLRSGVLTATLAVAAAATVVPFLVAYQRRKLWIERSAGIDWDPIWKAKVHTAALVAAGPCLAGCGLLLLLAPGTGGERAVALLQLVAASAVVATLAGLATFEVPDQPWVSILFSTLLGVAVAALFIFYPRAWWLWLVFYGYLAGQLAGRAGHRVRWTERHS